VIVLKFVDIKEHLWGLVRK